MELSPPQDRCEAGDPDISSVTAARLQVEQIQLVAYII
jgi:hypothetical protein